MSGKQTWVVELLRAPQVNDFPDGFFPRRFYYKKDAERLVREVRLKGGDAMIRGVRP